MARSRELGNAAGLLTLFFSLRFFISFIGERMLGTYSRVFNSIPDIIATDRKGLSVQTVSSVILDAILQMLLMCAPFFAIGFVAAFVINVVQVKWKVSTKPMMPKLSKLNPVNGFKRIVSKQALFDLALSIVKIFLIFYIAYITIKDHANELFLLYDIPLSQAIGLVGDIIIDTGIRISLVYIVVGIADYIFQRHKFNEDMKMTKKEIKDEYKDVEGDPQIKGQQKQRMREASQRRMIQDVPKADVVITNPTHFAVSMKYDREVNDAPQVTAKGEDAVALQMRRIAAEAGVPIVENRPLARSLYAETEVGDIIPDKYLSVLANVYAEIMRYGSKKM